MTRRSSFDLYNTSDFSSVGTPDHQHPTNYQAHLSSTGLPDLNMMFTSQDPFNLTYSNQNMGRQQYSNKSPSDQIGQDTASSPESMFGTSGSTANSYDSLEVQLFGPLPPYLLQGQQQMQDGSDPRQDMQMGAGGDITGRGGVSSGMQTQQFMSGSAGGMNLDGFFGDEWDDVFPTVRNFQHGHPEQKELF
jgi:hypothetical protein